jgi:hypothetical protein
MTEAERAVHEVRKKKRGLVGWCLLILCMCLLGVDPYDYVFFFVLLKTRMYARTHTRRWRRRRSPRRFGRPRPLSSSGASPSPC